MQLYNLVQMVCNFCSLMSWCIIICIAVVTATLGLYRPLEILCPIYFARSFRNGNRMNISSQYACMDTTGFAVYAAALDQYEAKRDNDSIKKQLCERYTKHYLEKLWGHVILRSWILCLLLQAMHKPPMPNEPNARDRTNICPSEIREFLLIP